MQTETINLPVWHCVRCGWKWFNTEKKPRACPECKATNWDRPSSGQGRPVNPNSRRQQRMREREKNG